MTEFKVSVEDYSSPTSQAAKVQIKGVREGILVSLGGGSWEELNKALLDQLDQRAEFLRGARIALDVGDHVLRAVELGKLRSHISERQITLWAVISTSPITERNAQVLGLATRLSRARGDAATAPRQTPSQEGEAALLIQTTLLQGVSMKHSGHLTVIGDVNPGAEIIASGNIVIWGRLRGVAHAGSDGDQNAIICALDFSPTQLWIAGISPTKLKLRGKHRPQMARLEKGKLVVEPWNPKK